MDPGRIINTLFHVVVFLDLFRLEGSNNDFQDFLFLKLHFIKRYIGFQKLLYFGTMLV